jgi:hypothetical protein
MRAGLRLGTVLAAASLALGAASALAQSVPQQQNPPASDSVGPRDLQNFNLGGTVTRQAQPPSEPSATAPAPRSAQGEPATTESTTAEGPPAATRTRTPPAQTAAADTPRPAARNEAASPPVQASSSPSANALPTGTTATNPPPAPGFSTAAADASNGVLAPERKLTLWPWLLAALALGAGGAFLVRRSRAREAYAGGAEFDEFTAPEPTPRPLPRPVPKPAPAPPVAAPRPPPEPSIPGLVTTRLRPWLDIGIKPLRFVVEDDKVTIEFELELFNSGNAPARAVLLEAVLLNAGSEQEEQLRGFFANPVGEGERIVAIPPLKRVGLKTQVAVGREHVQQFDIAGKKVCVPVLAVNAHYESNGKNVQTSASYLLGRETEREKLAPFRLDLGPRLFRTVGTRPLPGGVRI